MSGMLGGLFGAAAGSWMYDRFVRGGTDDFTGSHGGTGNAVTPDDASGGGRGDFGDDPGSGGGDFGGDDAGGGGDAGGDAGGGDAGGGDFGGGGGDF
jgi:uncharacterized protein